MTTETEDKGCLTCNNSTEGGTHCSFHNKSIDPEYSCDDYQHEGIVWLSKPKTPQEPTN